MSRSTPDDKYLLVECLQEHYSGYTAVVGQLTGDAPALMKADVGFCMSDGTEVAK